MINFVSKARVFTFFFSFTFVVFICMIVANGVKLGMDFTGGGVVEFSSNAPEIDTIAIKNNLSKFNDVTISYTDSVFKITFLDNTSASSDTMTEIKNIINNIPDAKIRKVDFMGAKFGKDILLQSCFALCLALLAIYLYVTLKFGNRLAIGASFALIYNCVASLGASVLFNIEISLMAISAFLTIIGYCINDTVVVFDRIKQIAISSDNKTKDKDIINSALNIVMKRSIITPFVTSLSILPLVFIKTADINHFAVLILCGIFFGTLSSLAITPIMASFCKIKIKLPSVKHTQDDPMRFV